MKLMKKFMKKSEGFTLVELIVVIAILAILAGVAIPVYSGYIKKANDASVITQLDAILSAAQAANAASGGVTGISVNETGTTISVGGELASDFNSNFCLFYGIDDSKATALGVFTVSIDFANTSYENEGAYWNGQKWVIGSEDVTATPDGNDPDPDPSEDPTPEPSDEPDPEPSDEPDPEPSDEPDPEPSEEPSQDPNPETTDPDWGGEEV